MTVTLVVARATNGVIGADGTIPWHAPGDLAHFKELTSGHPIVMGRITFESIGRPLPDRTSIVITRDPDWYVEGVLTFGSVSEAIEHAQRLDSQVFVIGGSQIYASALEDGLVDRLVVSEIRQSPSGDTWFHVPDGWIESDRRNDAGFDVVEYVLDPQAREP